VKQQSADRHIAPLVSDTLSWFRTNQCLFFPLKCCLLSGKATNTNFIVFGFIWSWLEPTIYRTRGEHALYFSPYFFVKSSKLYLNSVYAITINISSKELFKPTYKLHIHIYIYTHKSTWNADIVWDVQWARRVFHVDVNG
jgi:hypothetical protein